MLQLGAQDAGVQVVQAAVEAVAVDVRAVGAVIAQPAHRGSISALLVTIAPPSPKVPRFFWMMKLVQTASLNCADLEAVAARADSLGVVLDHQELVLVGDLADGLHVGALAVEMDRDDGLGLGRDGRFDLGRVDALGLRVAIDEDGRGAGDPDGFGGGEKGVGVGDALRRPGRCPAP